MKIDFHCHTKEGSIDAKISIENYIKKLIEKGFDGMLVTDHNSYNGYRKFEEIRHRLHLDDKFIVFKGIEYDTRDAGHFIAVLPEHISETFLEVRGMTIRQLEKIVHSVGGILGPAHPFGTGYFAYTNTHFGKNNLSFLKKMDFIETFNACVKPLSNLRADLIAAQLNKPNTGGSDAHKLNIVGSAFTEFEHKIKNNNELIQAIKSGHKMVAGGSILQQVCLEKNLVVEYAGIGGYWLYNKTGALLNHFKINNIVKEWLAEK